MGGSGTGYQGWSSDQPISFVFALQAKNALLRCTNIELVGVSGVFKN